MKKILLFVIVLLSIFTGCNFKISGDFETGELKRPDVEEDTSGMVIRFAVPTKPVNSILVYRYENENSSTSNADSSYKMKESDIIGFINVSKLSQSDNITYYFNDKNIENEKEYQYRARYTYTDTTIQYSKWSNSILAKNEYEPTTNSDSTIELLFDKNDMELTIPSDYVKKVDEDNQNYEYSIIFRARQNASNNNEITQLFALSSETILLTKTLPKVFLESDGGLWIDGIIQNSYLAFKTEEIQEDDFTKEIKIPTKIGFSKKIPVSIDGKTSTKDDGVQIIEEKIQYDDNSSGIDFSKKVVKFQ